MKPVHRPLFVAVIALSLLALSCEISVDLGQATPVPSERPTEMVTPSITPLPTETPALTATPDYVATQSAEDMQILVEQLARDGYLITTPTDLILLPDFTATLSTFKVQKIDLELNENFADFILVMDVSWEMDPTGDGWGNGCGVAIRTQGNNDSYEFVLINDYDKLPDLIGYFYLQGHIWRKGYFAEWPFDWQFMGRVQMGPMTTSGSVNMLIVAQGNDFKLFLDGKFTKTFIGYAYDWLSGGIGYVLYSQSQNGFGVRCSYSNGALWILEP